MSDDFGLLLRSTTGEAPSPEFVGVLRERVLAEATTRQATMNGGPVVPLEYRSDNQGRTVTWGRWVAGGLIAAIALFLAAVVVMNRDDNITIESDDPAAESSETTVESAVEEGRVQLLSVPFPDGGTLIEAGGDANQVFVTIQYSPDRFGEVLGFYDESTAADSREWLRSPTDPTVASRDISWKYDPGNVSARVRLTDCENVAADSESVCLTIRETGDYPP